MKLSLGLLKKLGACAEAIEAYEKRQESDPVVVIKLLIDGCEELKHVSRYERLQWANWLIVRLLSHKDAVRYAVFAAEAVLEMFEEEYPNDNRPRRAIEAAKAWLQDQSEENKRAAYAAYAAYAAADATDAAYAAAAYATYATYVAYAAYAGYAAYVAYVAYAGYAADYNAMLKSVLNHGIELLKGEICNG